MNLYERIASRKRYVNRNMNNNTIMASKQQTTVAYSHYCISTIAIQ